MLVSFYNLFFSFITTDTCDKFTNILLIVSSKDSYVRWYWMLCVQSTKFMVNGWLYFLPRISVLITSKSVFGSFPFTKTFLSLQTNTVHWVTDPAKLQWNFFLKIQQPSSRKDNTFSFFQESFQKFILNIYDVKKKSSIGSWQVYFFKFCLSEGYDRRKKDTGI